MHNACFFRGMDLDSREAIVAIGMDLIFFFVRSDMRPVTAGG
jgi:hypothetical protein